MLIVVVVEGSFVPFVRETRPVNITLSIIKTQAKKV